MKTSCWNLMSLLLAFSVAVYADEPPSGDGVAVLDKVKEAHADGGCFYIHSVDSYRVIDPYHILLYAPSRHKPWLIEFSHACPLLRNGDTIMLEGSSGQVCGNAGDALRTENQNCGILKVFSISPEGADAIKASLK